MPGKPIYCPKGECPKNNAFACMAGVTPLSYTMMGGSEYSSPSALSIVPYAGVAVPGLFGGNVSDWTDWHNCPRRRRMTD